MAVRALKGVCCALGLLLVLSSLASACFGPKLLIGRVPGTDGELHYHLVAIYLHEKTGIDSTPVELAAGQSAADAIAQHEIDLGFVAADSVAQPVVLRLDNGMQLLSGERPQNDLQFTTALPALQKLQQRLDKQNLDTVRTAIKRGVLPATAIRNFMLEQGWI